jgi:succinate dehydrogenase / fumarate reductase membrane anchor subunit
MGLDMGGSPIMSLRSPLGRVLGLGSARDGTGHWWAQRVSAVALIPLTLWFMFSLLALPALDYATVRAWLSFPVSGFLAVLLVAVLTYHSHLGTVEVIEDYVHSAGMKVLSLLLLRFVHVLVGGAGIFAIMRVAFGS